MSNVDRLAYKVSEVAESLGISRARAYELVKAGEIPSVRLGGRVLVPADGLRRMLSGLPSDGDESKELAVSGSHVAA